MKFIDCTYDVFKARVQEKKIIQFGASSAWHYYLSTFDDLGITVLDKTILIIDNDKQKQDKDFCVSDHLFPVKDPNIIYQADENVVILLTVSVAYQISICEQLVNMKLPETMECYSLPLMISYSKDTDNSCVGKYFQNRDVIKIPSKIHCFWFSNEKKSGLYTRCIDSWKKNCPEYEIVEWNADNYDYAKNTYMKEAFENEKWAFVSDYARLDVVYEHGGIYMDMDVELVCPLDFLLYADSFFCRQEDGYLELGSGFGSVAKNPVIKRMLDTYSDRKLIMDDGEIDKTPQPEWLKKMIKSPMFRNNHNSEIIDDSIILSNDYIMCPTDISNVSNARVGIHWHNGGWLDDSDRKLIIQSKFVRKELVDKYFYSTN